jgi:dihydroorotase
MRTLIRNGTVAGANTFETRPLDILIADGRVVEVGAGLPDSGADVIDARGRLVVPGLVDVHVHFREPGQEYKEDIRSGSGAAAAGGFTAVVAEPNTVPPIDTPERVRCLLASARESSIVRFYTKAAITADMMGADLADIAGEKEAGARAISDDGHPVPTARLMRRAFERAAECGILVSPHCEESARYWEIVRRHSRDTGEDALPEHRPPPGKERYDSEARFIARDLALAEKSGARVHVSHVSLAESVEIIAAAKRRGVRVTAEAAPHHFVLTDADARRIGPNAKANPPLRSRRDVEAVKEGLRNGTIDVIASDHAPHAPDEKRRPWNDAPFGVIGLETTLGLVLTHLVRPGVLTLAQAIEKMTAAPARIYGLDAEGVGRLEPGTAGDLTVIDLDREWKVAAASFQSKARNCPFEGMVLRGKAVLTTVAGRVVARDGVLAAG